MKMQREHLLKVIGRYLEKNKYQVGVSEIKLTRNLRMELNALMNAFSSIGEDKIDFIDIYGNKVVPELEYVENMGR